MPSYLVETYLARSGVPGGLHTEGAGVRVGLVIQVPEDEVCWYLFETSSDKAAAEAVSRAGLDLIRLVKVLTHIPKDVS